MKKLLITLACIFTLSSISHAQNEEYVKRVATAYGFLKGQSISSNEIKKNFPDLEVSVIKAEISFFSNFSQAEKNMKTFLVETLGEKGFQTLNAQGNAQMKELLSKQRMTRENAVAFIKEIENRAKGKIETPILETLLSFQYADHPEAEFSARHRYTFRTKGHPKAKGTDWQIEIPKSWKSEEAERPNIIQKFISSYGDGTEMIMMMVGNLDYAPSRKEIEEMLSQEQTKEFLPDNMKLLSFENVTIDRLPCAMFEYEGWQERVGMSLKMRVLQFSFIEADKLYIVQCQIVGLKDQEVSERMQKYQTLFKKMIANSIVVHSQY